MLAQGEQLFIALVASVVGAVVLHDKKSEYDLYERKLNLVSPLESHLEHDARRKGLDPVPDCVRKDKSNDRSNTDAGSLLAFAN